MFAKFECGCIGIINEGTAYIVKPCDDWAGEFSFHKRNMDGKKYAPLSAEEVETVARELNRLISEGYGLRQIKSIIRIAD